MMKDGININDAKSDQRPPCTQVEKCCGDICCSLVPKSKLRAKEGFLGIPVGEVFPFGA